MKAWGVYHGTSSFVAFDLQFLSSQFPKATQSSPQPLALLVAKNQRMQQRERQYPMMGQPLCTFLVLLGIWPFKFLLEENLKLPSLFKNFPVPSDRYFFCSAQLVQLFSVRGMVLNKQSCPCWNQKSHRREEDGEHFEIGVKEQSLTEKEIQQDQEEVSILQVPGMPCCLTVPQEVEVKEKWLPGPPGFPAFTKSPNLQQVREVAERPSLRGPQPVQAQTVILSVLTSTDQGRGPFLVLQTAEDPCNLYKALLLQRREP